MHSYKIKYLEVNDNVKKSVEDFLLAWFDSTDHIITFTSGSTGKPKAIRLLKSKMIISAMMTGQFLGLKENDRALLCLSPDTIAGKMMIIRSITLNLELIVCPITSNPFKDVDLEIDFVAMVPLQLSSSIDNYPDQLHKIRNIIIGGGIITPTLFNKLKNNHLTIFHTYGMTETISHVAMRRVGLINEEFFSAIGETFFSELNGQLVIHSSLLETKTITTNDSIELIDNKTFIFKGRTDFVINSGGVKIHPEEIENKLNCLIEEPFFIAGLPDEYLGEKVILCIEHSGSTSLNGTKLKELLSIYEFPKKVYYIPQFTRTESGKINRLETVRKINGDTLRSVI